jgi:hypothetical protein
MWTGRYGWADIHGKANRPVFELIAKNGGPQILILLVAEMKIMRTLTMVSWLTN